MDTSSRCQAYFGGAKTVSALNPSAELAARGAQFISMRAEAPSISNDCVLPLIDTVPSGWRMIIANNESSFFPLTVANGIGLDTPQTVVVSAGFLVECYLEGPESVGGAVPHFGPGLSPLWTGYGFWRFDISPFDRFPPLG